MYWNKKFYLYRILTCWMPDANCLMPIKRVLLRWCGVVVGRGVQISSGVRFIGSGKIVLGDNVMLLRGVQIGGRGLIVLHNGVSVSEDNVIRANGEIEIGERTEIYQSNILMANGSSKLTIGRDCQIAHMISLKTSHHLIQPEKACVAGDERFTDIKVGDGCWICAGAMLIPGVEVGAKCVVAAGAVVTRNTPPLSLVAGVPAKVRKIYKEG